MASPTVWLYLPIIFVTTSLFAASACPRTAEMEVPFLSTATNRQNVKIPSSLAVLQPPATVAEMNGANP